MKHIICKVRIQPRAIRMLAFNTNLPLPATLLPASRLIHEHSKVTGKEV